jgi:hypothetical protein
MSARRIAGVALGLLWLAAPGVGVRSGSAGTEALDDLALGGCAGTELSQIFSGPGDAKVFSLIPTANGRVKVSTKDAGTFGPDLWRAEAHEVGLRGMSRSGNGRPDVFSGRVSIHNLRISRDYQAVISPDLIRSGFPPEVIVCVEGPVTVVGPLPE